MMYDEILNIEPQKVIWFVAVHKSDYDNFVVPGDAKYDFMCKQNDYLIFYVTNGLINFKVHPTFTFAFAAGSDEDGNFIMNFVNTDMSGELKQEVLPMLFGHDAQYRFIQ